MAISARSRRGTSPSFWRNHNTAQMMMIEACMSSRQAQPAAAKASVAEPVAPVWVPTSVQRERYQKRSKSSPTFVTRELIP